MRGGRSRCEPFRLLFICTGNICRSPLAERLGRAYLDEVLGPDSCCVHVSSAGTAAVVGASMHPASSLVLRGLGGNPEGFVARQLSAALPEGSDLIVTMTREHRGAVLALAPRSLSRTYTLREAAGLVSLVEEEPAGLDFRERARELVARMAALRGHRTGGEADDTPDPIGLPEVGHQRVGDLIAADLLTLLARFSALVDRRADGDEDMAGDEGGEAEGGTR